MPDEVKTETTTTTPVVDTTATTSVEQTPVTAETGKTTETATNTVEKVDTIPTPKTETGLSKGIKTDIYKLRAERRELREKVERLEKLVNEKTNVVNKPTEEPTPTFFDDPEKRLAIEKQNIKSELIAEIQKQEVEKIRAEQIKQEGQQTIEMLLAKPEINGDIAIIEEIDEIIINDPRLAEIVKISPELAGKTAYEMWAKDKGIDVQSKKAAVTAKVATSAPSSTSMTTKPARTIADIQAEAAKLDPSDPKFNEKWQSLLNESLSVK